MGAIVNLTKNRVAHAVGVGSDGQWQVTATVKATFAWDNCGRAIPADTPPLVEADEFAGEPATSGLLRAAEVGPPKPKVDVLLVGAMVFPKPVVQVDVELAVGTRLRKRARVFGDRVWLPGMFGTFAPWRPRPVTRIPIAWERCYGGADAAAPAHVELRNPAGSGVAQKLKTLQGRPAPNFEDPEKALGSIIGKPSPVGFGPIAPHWQPRIKLAGTYDEAWLKNRSPLLPVDFHPAYFNTAPTDQQIDGYVAGEVVRLFNMTTGAREHWQLPEFSVPITIATKDGLFEDTGAVDTIVIEPEARRFSLLARAQAPLADALAFGCIVVGPITRGLRAALESGKRYVPRGRPR